MSTYDKASLVLIPSGTKEGVVFSQKPTNGDGDFTFTRASSATRVNSDGLIEKETQNLLLQSNTFNTTWGLDSGMSLTSGQSGYDGSSDAWRLDKPAANFREMYQSVTYSGVSTFSCYAKSGSLTALTLRFIDGVSNHYARFNLSSGTPISSTGTVIDMTMESVGSGWYRCSAVTSGISGNAVYIYPDIEYNDVIGNIYIQDAQLNQGLVADSYLETTTTAVYGGITDNIPRLDYTDASCPSLLLEPQRTNVIPHSEYLNDSSWVKNVNASVSQNHATSPDGKNNASLISNTLVGGSCDYFVNLTGSASTTYTLSAFVKESTHSKCVLRAYVGHAADQSTPAVIFDLSSGSIVQEYGVATNSDINPIGDDGWYRVQMSFLTAGTNLYFNVLPLSDSYGWATAYNAPNNYGSVGGILAFGAQAEISSYPTSYIPTYGASVTKLQDECSVTGVSDLIGQTEGTLYFEGFAIANESTSKRISLSDGTNANRVAISFGLNAITFIVVSNNVASLSTTITSSPDTNHKIALAYKENDFVAYLDGTQVVTDSSGATFSGALNSFRFSDGQSGLSLFAGDTKQAILFKTRLSNEELADLTTI